MNKINITIIGLGYVGFPLACAIAKNKKYSVYGYDLDTIKIKKINDHISPIEDIQAEKDIKKITIHATSDDRVLEKSKFIIICVPTPVNADKKPDLTPVIQAVNKIANFLSKGQIIILESTVNPGVSEEIILPILEKTGLKGGVDFELVHCPERIDPGNTKWNVYNIPRNIGGTSKNGTHIAAEFYRSFIKAPVNEMTGLKVAESTKIVENVFRDVNIAYVNELAKSFDKLGIDIIEVIKGASSKPFGFMPHYPGCGVGGHCIAVDPYYLIDYAEKNGFDHKFLKMAREINNSMPEYTLEKLKNIFKKNGISLKGSKIGVLGLSYKSNIKDLRESPALEIKRKLIKEGAEIYTSEPYCTDSNECKQHVLYTTPEVLDNVEAVILTACHDEFKKIQEWKNVKIIIDGRNCLDMDEIKKKGIIYKGIGRGE